MLLRREVCDGIQLILDPIRQRLEIACADKVDFSRRQPVASFPRQETLEHAERIVGHEDLEEMDELVFLGCEVASELEMRFLPDCYSVFEDGAHVVDSRVCFGEIEKLGPFVR